MKPLDFKDMGPCGGFSTQYACYCDYYNMPYREEVGGALFLLNAAINEHFRLRGMLTQFPSHMTPMNSVWLILSILTKEI